MRITRGSRQLRSVVLGAAVAVLSVLSLVVGSAVPAAVAVPRSAPSADTADVGEATPVPAAEESAAAEELPKESPEGPAPEESTLEDAAPQETVPEETVPEEPVPEETAAQELASEAALDPAASAVGVTVPAGKNQVAADVLGLGYEQVVRLSGSRVEIVDPVIRGGEVLRSFEAGASSAWPNNGQSSHAPLFYGGRNMSQRMVGHSASRLAVAGTHIYVSNLQTHTSHGRKVANGTVTRRFTVDGVVVNTRVEQAAFAVTSMDGFVWKGREYVAIGLNYSGVRILDVDQAGMPDRRVMLSHWMGPHRKGGENVERDQIVEVKFGVDEHGRFIVVAGAMTQEMPALVALEVETEREIWAKNFRPWQNGWEWPEVIEMGPFAPNGRVSLAVGWPTLGHLEVMDAASGHERKRFTGGVASVVRYFTDASGEPRLAFRRGIGNVWDASLARPDANGVPIVLATVGGDALEWMVPGSRPWSVEVENQSRAEVGFRTFTGASREEGCWRGKDLHGAQNPLPISPVGIPARGRVGPFTAAQVIWGDSCRDNPGVFYAQVEPAGEPAHRQVVQFRADAQGIRVKEQVGTGRLAVSVEPVGTSTHAFRLVVTDRHIEPTVVGSPVLEAARLTPAPQTAPSMDPDDPNRPVRRFTVSGVTWQVPGASGDLTAATVPLPFAEASVDGGTWDRLGTVTSPLAPVLKGDRVEMGQSVFDWQTAAGASKDYRFFRVTAGSSVSNVVDVEPLDVPPPTTIVQSLTLTGTETPRANGLDQSPMRASLRDFSSQGLDTVAHAALYQRIYYRDETTKALITGLGNPAEPNELVMFSLTPGQYANESLDVAAGGSIGVYFSARYTQQNRQVRAVFRQDGVTKTPRAAVALLRPLAKTFISDGTGAGGLTVGSCDERAWTACALMDPTATPTLHSLTGSTVSIEFRTIAVPGTASLPLAERDRPAEQLRLVSDALAYRGRTAMLQSPGQFGPQATITADLIARGDRVVAENHPVKAKG